MNDSLDLSEFEAAMTKRGPTCWFAVSPFTPEQRAKLEYVCFGRSDISHVAIAKVLATWNFKVSAGTVSRHRRRGKPNGCGCPESKPGKE
jgi:hypothetical protein